jgi:DNA-binding IclR family transcriptional regulator
MRKAIKELGKKRQAFTLKELGLALDLISDADKRPLYRAMRDLERSGFVVKVSPGVYRLGEKKRRPELQDVMWRLLRARRQVSIDDLVELSGCAPAYAAEWLQNLERRGVVARTSKDGVAGVWKMTADPVEMPLNEEKAERLRALRAERRRALVARANAALDAAYQAIIQARIEINSIEETER